MILNRNQIKQLAAMAGFDVVDIAGSDMQEEFEIYKGNLADVENGDFIDGIVACSHDYPEDLCDILKP